VVLPARVRDRRQQTSTYLNRDAPLAPRIDADVRSIPPRLQTVCKHTLTQAPACSQAGSRPKRELVATVIGVGSAFAPRATARQTSLDDVLDEKMASPEGWPGRGSPEGRAKSGGADETRTRDLRRDSH
jgi:hypothetical protein